MSSAVRSERVRVLVPLDGSEFARQVIPYAIRVLRPETHVLTLLKVAPVPEGYSSVAPRPLTLEGWSARDGWAAGEPPVYYSQVYDSAVANLEEEVFADARRLVTAGFEVTPEVRFGDPADEIVSLIEEGGYDLVVMATHGRSGLGRVLMGSVAGAVLKRVHVPVMMVRPLPEGAGEGLGAVDRVPSRAATDVTT